MYMEFGFAHLELCRFAWHDPSFRSVSSGWTKISPQGGPLRGRVNGIRTAKQAAKSMNGCCRSPVVQLASLVLCFSITAFILSGLAKSMLF